jgi:glycosyltransferase involved in cell wall biosynthesis
MIRFVVSTSSGELRSLGIGTTVAPGVTSATVRGPTAAFLSFRLGGSDGVAIEAAKWEWALEQLGFAITTVAGEGDVDHLVRGLEMSAIEGPDPDEVSAAIEDADLVVVENLCSLPLNPAALEVVASVLKGRRAILHHHDLPWQRPATASMPPPPDDPSWLHVTINELSRVELAERGIEAFVSYNCFETETRGGDRGEARRKLGVDDKERVVIQPTRAIPRKNVAGAVHLSEELRATYWLLGPAEDGYGRELERILEVAKVRVIRGGNMKMADAYAACDVVAMPSFWEGFGNPSVESAIHLRPLLIGPYPVAKELEAFGFEWFHIGEEDALAQWLDNPEPDLVTKNLEVARAHFSLKNLPPRLDGLFKEAGWISW